MHPHFSSTSFSLALAAAAAAAVAVRAADPSAPPGSTSGGFLPDMISSNGASCAEAFGKGFETCREKRAEDESRVCYDPSRGDVCCQATVESDEAVWACPGGSRCTAEPGQCELLEEEDKGEGEKGEGGKGEKGDEKGGEKGGEKGEKGDQKGDQKDGEGESGDDGNSQNNDDKEDPKDDQKDDQKDNTNADDNNADDKSDKDNNKTTTTTIDDDTNTATSTSPTPTGPETTVVPTGTGGLPEKPAQTDTPEDPDGAAGGRLGPSAAVLALLGPLLLLVV